MEQRETVQIRKTDDFVVDLMTDQENGEEFSREYIKKGFLSSARRLLFEARRQAKLTQAEVAERLHTKQAAIARWEKDREGSMSLRNFVEFLMACGKAPFDITDEAYPAFREYVLAHPEAPRTQMDYHIWHSQGPEVFSIEGVKTTVVSNPVSSTYSMTFTEHDGKLVAETADKSVRSAAQERHRSEAGNTSANRHVSLLSQKIAA